MTTRSPELLPFEHPGRLLRMTVLFDGDASVHYGFLWFDAVGGTAYETDLMDARAGQTNGLLGAVEPGVLSMVTGMHSGLVALRVEVLDTPPTDVEDWEDVVEASIDVRSTDVVMSAFEWGTSFTLPAPGWYRARWSDSGMDAGRQHERYEAAEPVVERCLLQLWPAPPAPDAVLRETSAHASYWHREARTAPPRRTLRDRALAEQHERNARAEVEARSQREFELSQWGGRDPSPRLREAVGAAGWLVREHRDLADALVELPPQAQRALALDLTEEFCAAAANTDVDWGSAVTALRRGERLPAPFDSRSDAARAVHGSTEDQMASIQLVVRVGPPPPRVPSSPVESALGAVFAAAQADELTAVLEVVAAGSWSASDLDGYAAEIGRRVRELSGPSS